MSSSPPDPRDKRFGPVPLPDKFEEFRDVQWEKIQEVVELFNSGTDVVMLKAPTGTGKTLIAETVRRLLATNAYYTCTTKSLQDQFAADFRYARVLKGRANYLTYSGNLDELGNPRPSGSRLRSAVTCQDCTGNPANGLQLSDDDEYEDDEEVASGCDWCPYKSACPFTIAKEYMQVADLAVVNTQLLLTDRSLRPRPFVIADEADQLESILMGAISLELTPTRMGVYGLRPPHKKTKPESWVDWCNYALGVVHEYYDDLPNERLLSVIKERRRTQDLLRKLAMLRTAIPEGQWVYDGYDNDPDHVVFKPVRIAKYAPDALWSKGNKWLLMSATIANPLLMAEDLGLYDTTFTWNDVTVPTGFPAENRPIFVVPVADMSFKNIEQGRPEMLKGILGVSRRHPDERVLVHTVSYDLARYLYDNVRSVLHERYVGTYSSSADRNRALEDYRANPASILFAPSLDRGIDLPGDDCRVQVVAKIPFPNRKDKQINARLFSDGGTAWYKGQAVQTLEQMTGRAVRSPTDKAVTYILDSQFGDNLWKADFLFDNWWKEAIRWDMSPMQLERGQ